MQVTLGCVATVEDLLEGLKASQLSLSAMIHRVSRTFNLGIGDQVVDFCVQLANIDRGRSWRMGRPPRYWILFC